MILRLQLCLAITFLSLTAGAQAFVPEDQKLAEKRNAACSLLAEKLVIATAKNMGWRTDFGVRLTRKPGPLDMHKRPLLLYESGVFKVDDGFISNSYAIVTARPKGTSCEIIKLDMAIGG